MKRRAFFQSLAKAAAIVALAPQLAFRVKPEIPQAPKELVAFWCQTTRLARSYDDDYIKALEHAMRQGNKCLTMRLAIPDDTAEQKAFAESFLFGKPISQW